MDEAPRYQCFVVGCPGNHPSKRGVCEAFPSKERLSDLDLRCLIDSVRAACGQSPALPFGDVVLDCLRELKEWRRTGGRSESCAPETGCVGWQSIETAPRDGEAIFWIVSKDPDECYLDTSGRPITSCATPRMELTHYGRWSSLSKATAWMPKPTPPKTPAEGG